MPTSLAYLLQRPYQALNITSTFIPSPFFSPTSAQFFTKLYILHKSYHIIPTFNQKSYIISKIVCWPLFCSSSRSIPRFTCFVFALLIQLSYQLYGTPFATQCTYHATMLTYQANQPVPSIHSANQVV